MDEYIKRQDAIDEVMEMVKDHSGDKFGGVLLHYTGIKAMLECIEPADVKPVVRGKWKKWGEDEYECSCCGVLWTFPDGTPEENDANFCPNCGSYNGGDISVDE